METAGVGEAHGASGCGDVDGDLDAGRSALTEVGLPALTDTDAASGRDDVDGDLDAGQSALTDVGLPALADTGPALWEVAREAALELPGSELYPFAEDWEAVRVRGKWFLVTTDCAPAAVTGRAGAGCAGSRQAESGTAGAAGAGDGGRIVNLKADPEDVRALIEAYPSILPGYHMSKRHWITLRPGADLTAALVRELVTESYLLVVATLPRSRRPVDPSRFGRI